MRLERLLVRRWKASRGRSFRTTLAWSLGEGCALDAVLDHKRSAVSHHEAYEDDISDAAPEGDDWAAVALPGVGRHRRGATAWLFCG